MATLTRKTITPAECLDIDRQRLRARLEADQELITKGLPKDETQRILTERVMAQRLTRVTSSV